jgi:hypothetical protein
MMAQMLSTFSATELSRFQAYRRSCFNASVVEGWVADCLHDRFGMIGRPLSSSLFSKTQRNREDKDHHHCRSLQDLVAPGQAQDIGSVVAVAAKIYAQRLVSEALHRSNNGKYQGALTSDVIWQVALVQQNRQHTHFFVQPESAVGTWSAFFARSQDQHDTKRLAAQHAEAEYDRWKKVNDVNAGSNSSDAMTEIQNSLKNDIAAASTPVNKLQQQWHDVEDVKMQDAPLTR